MNEREPLSVVVVKVLVSLLPLAFIAYAHDQYAVDRRLEQLAYRARLLSWRWRVWRRLDQGQRERYVELHGEPEP